MSPNPSLVTRMSARRAWTFQVGGTSHVVQLGPDSAWTDRPSRLWLNDTPLHIDWFSTDRSWWAARWEARLAVGPALVVLVCKRRVRGGWAQRFVAALRGAFGGADLARTVRRSRRTVYFLTVDGRPVPHPPRSSEDATRPFLSRRRAPRPGRRS